MKLRNRSPVLRDSLYVTHSLANLNIKSGQFIVRSVKKSKYDNIKHGVLSWFSKNGSFDHADKWVAEETFPISGRN